MIYVIFDLRSNFSVVVVMHVFSIMVQYYVTRLVIEFCCRFSKIMVNCWHVTLSFVMGCLDIVYCPRNDMALSQALYTIVIMLRVCDCL